MRSNPNALAQRTMGMFWRRYRNPLFRRFSAVLDKKRSLVKITASNLLYLTEFCSESEMSFTDLKFRYPEKIKTRKNNPNDEVWAEK